MIGDLCCPPTGEGGLLNQVLLIPSLLPLPSIISIIKKIKKNINICFKIWYLIPKKNTKIIRIWSLLPDPWATWNWMNREEMMTSVMKNEPMNEENFIFFILCVLLSLSVLSIFSKLSIYGIHSIDGGMLFLTETILFLFSFLFSIYFLFIFYLFFGFCHWSPLKWNYLVLDMTNKSSLTYKINWELALVSILQQPTLPIFVDWVLLQQSIGNHIYNII